MALVTVSAGISEFCVRNVAFLDKYREICAARHVLLADVVGTKKTASLTAARVECWALVRKAGFSYPEIGALWERDHTTIMAALKNLKPGKILPTERKKFNERISILEEKVAKLERMATYSLARF